MNVILVANDNSKEGKFSQMKVEVLNTLSNILFIKQLYPDFKIIFFVDETTKQYYSDLGLLDFVDEVNESVLNRSYDINKEVFWAYSKIFALRATPAPCVMFDLDYRIFDDIREIGFFNSDVGAYCFEDVLERPYYLKPEECLDKIEIPKDFDWDDLSINVSSLYFKENDFKNLYCDWIINYMYAWSFEHRNDTKNYSDSIILFAEQYMLNQLIKKHNKKISVIIDDSHSKPLPDYGVSLGTNAQNYYKYVYHYGRMKSFFDTNSQEYSIEIDTIVNYVNYKIKNEKGVNHINDLKNNPKYERYFR